MATALPEFRPFHLDSEPTSVGIRWKAWLSEFENLLIALNITDGKRQRALMLFYGGNEIHEVYRSLTTPTDDLNFEDAKKKLTDYFEPKVNLTFEIFHFRQMRQGVSDDNESVSDDEAIDSFITRLRKKAARCNFTDAKTEIKYQLIFGCRSSQLRRFALQKDDVSLDDLLKKGRAYESSERQAAVIENKEPQDKEVKRITRKTGRYSNKTEFTENKSKTR